VRRALGLILCAAVAGPAWAAPPVFNPDPLTVSGRFELAKAAEGPLKGRLRLADAKATPDDAKVFMSKPEPFDAGLAAAMTASLRNFGYLAPPDAKDAIALDLQLDPLEITPDKDGVTVVARLRAAPSAGAAAPACLPRVAEAKYRALAPVHGGNGQKVFGVIALVAFAAVGWNAGELVRSEFADANANQAAANARRERIEGESVSPQPGDKPMALHAAVNATQLAAADFIRQLGKACGVPAAPAPPVTLPSTAPVPATSG
jgi:hypothetical protein